MTVTVTSESELRVSTAHDSTASDNTTPVMAKLKVIKSLWVTLSAPTLLSPVVQTWSIMPAEVALRLIAQAIRSESTRTGHPGRVLTPDQLVWSGYDHRFPVTQELIAVMVCDQSIIGHYS